MMTRNGILPLPSLLRASAQDAANMQMRKSCRKKWNRADYNAAASTLDSLTEGHYGAGIEGQYRFQVAEQMERAGMLTISMDLAEMNEAIDAAIN